MFIQVFSKISLNAETLQYNFDKIIMMTLQVWFNIFEKTDDFKVSAGQ